MPDLEARMDRIEHAIHSLGGVTGELARGVNALVQGLSADRTAFRETLRELSGFVATAGLEMGQLARQVGRLAEMIETGFTRMETGFTRMETGFARMQLAVEDNNRLIADNNRLIADNNAVIRRLLDILARGRGNGPGPPDSPEG